MTNFRTPHKTVYHFDDFSVDEQNFAVKKSGETLTITPRAFDVLSVLLRNGGQVVEKRQLFDEIWGETFVTDNALTKVIKELRHALRDAADDPRYIETVPKRGYRFIGDLGTEAEPIDESGPASVEPQPAPRRTITPWLVALSIAVLFTIVGGVWFALSNRTSLPNTRSIAVLPFKPLDAGSRDESLELGMAESLINRLSNLRDVTVTPINSARKYGDPAQDPMKAGAELQTDSVLDGSIQKVGDRVRVSVRLVDVSTGAAIWSEQFDENFTDIFNVQDSIAQRIAGALTLRLSRREQELLAKHMTESPEAYELYLRGQFNWHRRAPGWIHESMSAYRQALEKDPNFALAYIGLADGYIMQSGHREISVGEARANAEPNIARALEIDGNLAEAHNALAELKYQYQYDWNGAETEFKTALDLNPNVAWIHQAYGWFLMCQARFDEANAEMDRARHLDPSSLTLSAAQGRLYYFSRQYDRAIQFYLDMLKREPNDPSIHYALYGMYEQKGMYAEAFESFIKNRALSGMPESIQQELRSEFAKGSWEGFQQRILREINHSRASTGQEYPQSFADVYVKLKDKEQSFYWLEKVFDRGDISIIQFKIDPAYDFLREDPRYTKLLSRINLQP